jgi:CubicO group peptidase (beta-lactamase class C family)
MGRARRRRAQHDLEGRGNLGRRWCAFGALEDADPADRRRRDLAGVSLLRFDDGLGRGRARLLGALTANHLPGDGDLRSFAIPGGYGEVGFDGMGFGLTMAIAKAPAAMQVIGSPGEYMWGGAASTIFWADPAENLAAVFMTQLLPSGTFNFRGQLKTLVYPAITC